ncbi:Virion protein [Trichinella pseudospiralis]
MNVENTLVELSQVSQNQKDRTWKPEQCTSNERSPSSNDHETILYYDSRMSSTPRFIPARASQRSNSSATSDHCSLQALPQQSKDFH